jgi:hypothetical protein
MVCHFKRIYRAGHGIGYGLPLARLSLLPYDIEEGLFSQLEMARAPRSMSVYQAILP